MDWPPGAGLVVGANGASGRISGVVAGIAVEDDLVAAAEHTLHGFEIEALARHVRRLRYSSKTFE